MTGHRASRTRGRDGLPARSFCIAWMPKSTTVSGASCAGAALALLTVCDASQSHVALDGSVDHVIGSWGDLIRQATIAASALPAGHTIQPTETAAAVRPRAHLGTKRVEVEVRPASMHCVAVTNSDRPAGDGRPAFSGRTRATTLLGRFPSSPNQEHSVRVDPLSCRNCSQWE